MATWRARDRGPWLGFTKRRRTLRRLHGYVSCRGLLSRIVVGDAAGLLCHGVVATTATGERMVVFRRGAGRRTAGAAVAGGAVAVACLRSSSAGHLLPDSFALVVAGMHFASVASFYGRLSPQRSPLVRSSHAFLLSCKLIGSGSTVGPSGCGLTREARWIAGLVAG